MDWLRRNWPDLLIGLALVAVIAGIVTTLLTGGSFFPVGSGGAGGGGAVGGDRPPQVSVPSRESEGNGGQEDPRPDEPGVAVLPGSEDVGRPPGAPDPAVGNDGDDGDSESAGRPPVPLAPDGADAQRTESPPAQSERAPQDDAPQDDAPEPARADVPADDPDRPADPQADERPADQPGRSEPVPSPEAASDDVPTDPYRVAVGAFGDRDNAERQASRFREDGYPVFLGQQGIYHIVLVGPYVEESEARRVRDRIAGGGYDIEPVIYRYRPDDAPAEPPAAGSPPVVATPEVAAAPVAGDGDAGDGEAADEDGDGDGSGAPDGAAAAPAISEGGRLLQVGAYADVDSAQPQVRRLESLGLTARRLQEGGMVKLVVGPFSGEALDDARIVLDGAGIDYFAR